MRVSVEPFHLYRLEERSDEQLETIFGAGILALSPLLEGFSSKHTVVISILLDTTEFQTGSTDWQRRGGESSILNLASRVSELWRTCSRGTFFDELPIEIVAENRLAVYAGQLVRQIYRSPSCGEGSLGFGKRADVMEDRYSYRFLKNYVEFEELWARRNVPDSNHHGALSPDVSPLLNLADLSQHAGIGIACELYSERKSVDSEPLPKYSCALLAATWQLYRLGCFQVDDKGSHSAEESPVVLGEHFPCDRTLTLLDPTFISVEHAVRLILRHVVGDLGDSQSADVALGHIAYLFMPSDWIPS